MILFINNSQNHKMSTDEIETTDELLYIDTFVNKIEEDGRVPSKGEKYYDFWQVLKSTNHTSVMLYKKHKLNLSKILHKDFQIVVKHGKNFKEFIKDQRICTKCTINKNLHVDFHYSHRGNACRAYCCIICYNKNREKYQASDVGSVKCLLLRAKQESANNFKKGLISISTYDLTEDIIHKKIKEQGGLCYRLKVPFDCLGGITGISCERIDNEKGYTEENCVIVCKEVQMGVKLTSDHLKIIKEKKIEKANDEMFIKRYRKKWLLYENIKLKELSLEKKDFYEIARVMGRSKESVRRQYFKLKSERYIL